jgi:hypothetical protein
MKHGQFVQVVQPQLCFSDFVSYLLGQDYVRRSADPRYKSLVPNGVKKKFRKRTFLREFEHTPEQNRLF